ncbi:hypothetical protein [Pseudomonas sp. N040]|uniref:hypothetical protein n=1 Tax=Pseudomonas sp. N040 TaxID=2785325 RepID=UPI0018A2906F|nr:hypothetical protein [Pseudomonas sp. N040]MBF7731645.1 hypothetical protein [Pseudomonas sp. N040]MBW7015289.1 hypothetical protein [Pseudomonas sp. N040]
MEVLLIACMHGAVTYFYAITHDDDRKIMIFTWINVVVACFLGNPIYSGIDIVAVFAGSTFGATHRESFAGLRRNRTRTKKADSDDISDLGWAVLVNFDNAKQREYITNKIRELRLPFFPVIEELVKIGPYSSIDEASDICRNLFVENKIIGYVIRLGASECLEDKKEEPSAPRKLQEATKKISHWIDYYFLAIRVVLFAVLITCFVFKYSLDTAGLNINPLIYIFNNILGGKFWGEYIFNLFIVFSIGAVLALLFCMVVDLRKTPILIFIIAVSLSSLWYFNTYKKVLLISVGQKKYDGNVKYYSDTENYYKLLSYYTIKHPEFNQASPNYSFSLVYKVASKANEFKSKGDTPEIALSRAIDYIFGAPLSLPLQLKMQSKASIPVVNSTAAPPKPAPSMHSEKPLCEFKSVMSNEDYRACGLSPPIR